MIPCATKVIPTAKTADKEHRPAWSGFLKFGLVTIPVRAYPAKSEKAEIGLHWLHAKCHSRIHYQKICPLHGEVPQSEIVSGYKVGKDRYIEIEPDELKKLKPNSADTVDIASTVPPEKIDDIYFTDTSYYLLPDGDGGVRPYLVFQEALADANRYGVGEAVLFRREHLVAIRAIDKLMTMTFLTYPDRVQDVGKFEKQLPEEKTQARERELALMLITQLADEHFDIRTYKDHYLDDLKTLIDAKAKGGEVEALEPAPKAKPINFMQALKESLKPATKSGHPGKRSRRVKAAKAS